MYDTDTHTVDEIAAMFRVGRSTLYRQLHAYAEGRDCALVIYRNTRTRKVDPDTNRRYGETGAGAQLEADRKWFPIGATRRPRLKAIIYVVDRVVARVRGIDPDGRWMPDDRGYMDVPVTAPLTEVDIARRLPTLPLHLGDQRPHAKGKIREYITL